MICVYEGSPHLAPRDPLPAFPLAPRLRPCRFRLSPPLDHQTRHLSPEFSSTQAAQDAPQTHADGNGSTIGQPRTPHRSDLGASQGVRFSGICSRCVPPPGGFWRVGHQCPENIFNFFESFKSFGGKGLRQKCPDLGYEALLISVMMGLCPCRVSTGGGDFLSSTTLSLQSGRADT